MDSTNVLLLFATVAMSVGAMGVATFVMRSNVRANERLMTRFLHEMRKLPEAQVEEESARVRWQSGRTVSVSPTVAGTVSAGPELAWSGQAYGLSLAEHTTLNLRRVSVMSLDPLMRSISGSDRDAVSAVVEHHGVRSAVASLLEGFGLSSLELTADGTLTVNASRFGLNHAEAKRFGELVAELADAIDAAELGARSALRSVNSGPNQVSRAQGAESGSPVSIPVQL